MAGFTGIIKTLSELTEQTTAADTDVIPIGASSPKKITFANLRKALGIEKVPAVINVTNTTVGTPITGGLFYQKSQNGLVVVNIRLSNVTLAATTVTPLFTLAEGYRPRVPINAVCVSWENVLQVQITENGTVSLYSQNAFTSRTVYGVAVFFTG